MIRAEDLKENLLNLRLGNKYVIYGTTRNNQKIFLRGIFLGEAGPENELYIFESNYGFKECFLKVDFLIGRYRIRKAYDKMKSTIYPPKPVPLLDWGGARKGGGSNSCLNSLIKMI